LAYLVGIKGDEHRVQNTPARLLFYTDKRHLINEIARPLSNPQDTIGKYNRCSAGWCRRYPAIPPIRRTLL